MIKTILEFIRKYSNSIHKWVLSILRLFNLVRDMRRCLA
jgi:hypothetical protein